MQMQQQRHEPAHITAIVVNDDPTQLNVLSGLLRAEGIQVFAFESAEDALAEMDAACLPNLIITDLYMPGIDGWRFCRLLRSPEFEAFNTVPILVVSATFAGEEASSITADLGANAFLPSPVDGRRFMDTVRALCCGKKPKETLHILVVEDSKTLAGLLAKRFREHGFTAEVALDIREALSHLSEAFYDIAVMDYHLPDGFGDSLLREIQEKNPDCVCVMITTDPNPSLALSWMTAGAAAYLRKPFDPEYLIELCVRARRERTLLRVETILEKRTEALHESEAELKKHLLYERCVADCVRRLSNSSDSLNDLQSVLEIMRKTVQVERAHIFLVKEDQKTGPCITLAYESCMESLPPYINNPDRQYRLVDAGSTPWLSTLQNNKPFIIFASDSNGLESQFWDDPAVLSSLFLPIFANNKLWGFLSLCDYSAPRPWQKEEIRNLQIITEVLGTTITRRQITKNLNKKTQEQQILLDTINTQIWYLTDCETYGQLNQARADFLGMDVKDVAYQRLNDFSSGNVADVCRLSNNKVFQTKKKIYTEEWMQNAAGEKRLLAIAKSPKFDTSGNVEYVVCAGTDITELHQAKEALQEQLEFVENLVQTAQTIILVLDVQGRIIRFNPYLETLTGFTLDEVSGKDWFRTFLKPESITEVKPLFLKAINGNQTTGNVNPIIAKDGREILVEWHDKTLMDKAGQPLGLLAIGQDVTERVRLQQKLLQIEKSESMERMAGAIAHLFNNHLAAVIGNLELLALEMPSQTKGFEHLMEAQTGAHQAANTSRMMLTYLGQSPGKPMLIDLVEAVRKLLADPEQHKTQGTRIVFNLPDSKPRIKIDTLHLQQVFSALLINAQESLGNDGEIRVSISTTSALQIPGSHRYPVDWQATNERYACLTIADTGCGMDDATIGQVFDPFFSSKFKGRGLGLAMVLGVVKANKGCITIESKSDSGSVFRVFLPLEPEPAVLSRPKETGDMEECRTIERSGTILVVDDHEMVRHMVRLMLNHIGFDVITAQDGEEAIQLFTRNQQHIRLVLTDLSMPRLNGWGTIKALRGIRPDIPVILSTGHDEYFAQEKSQSEHPVAFLKKPYQMDDLQKALARALRGIV